MREIEAGGEKYIIEKMNARDQFKFAKRLGKALIPMISGSEGGSTGKGVKYDERAFLASLAGVFDSISDDDLDFLISKGLSAVKKVLPEGGYRQMISNGIESYPNTDMAVVFQLLKGVVLENFEGFLKELPSALTTVEKAKAEK